MVEVGRDPDDFDIRPSQQHGQRAGIIGVPTEVSVKVHAHAHNDASTDARASHTSNAADSASTSSSCTSGCGRTRMLPGYPLQVFVPPPAPSTGDRGDATLRPLVPAPQCPCMGTR